jgi:type I restriction enzyme, S subunit
VSTVWPRVRLGDVLRFTPRPVTVESTRTYREIGIRSHGRGIFHKPPVTGLDLGNKKVFYIEPDDFVLNIVFAWEGAVAVTSEAEAGMIASHRFPTFRPNPARLELKYLLYWCQTELGRNLLDRVSPGGAGRNRTLNRDAFLSQGIPLPPLAEQRRVVGRIQKLAANIDEAHILLRRAASDVEGLLMRATAALLDDAGWPKMPLGAVLVESPRNGLSPKPWVESGGRPMLRINAVSSSPTRFVDLSAAKDVEVSDEEAKPFVLQHDDVFIVRYNGDINRVAKPAIYKSSSEIAPVFPDKLMRLRPDPSKMLPDFLVFALGARSVREQIEEFGRTTAGNIGINGANAKSFIVPVPPIPEQRQIVAKLDALNAETGRIERLQVEAAAELDILLPAILDRAFKGEL